MDDLKGYREILQEIELWELRLDDLKQERRYIIRKMSKPPTTSLTANYTGIPGTSMVILHLPREWKRVQEIDEKIEECQDILSLKREAKKRMERVMSQMDRLEYRVAYLRDVLRMTYKEIAKEVGLTEGWIRQVGMRVPRIRTKIPS